MRQDDGSELLGANNPRSATIGVIHVAPNDDRQSILAAILTQDKLGRKQVAVVLPEDNRAFQRPVDFDGLKNMRRGLKAQIVFIAPGGPGPAEFARQRRFPVYSSLESYARALQEEGQGSTVIKRGWGFARRQRPASPGSALPPPPLQTNGIEYEPTHPLPTGSDASEQAFTENGAQADDEGEQSHSGRNAALLGGAGLAAGLGLGALAAGEHEHDSMLPPGNEDWDQLPTPAVGTPIVDSFPSSNAPLPADAQPQDSLSATPAPSSTASAAGPGIIAFPSPQPRPRITGQLSPLPAVVPVPAAEPHPPAIQTPGRHRNGSRMAAAGAVGAVAGVGAGAAMAAHGAGVGTPPPPTRAGGGGGGSAGAARRRNRRLLALALIVLTLLLIGGIALASGGLGPNPSSRSATVKITPAWMDEKAEPYTIDAIPPPGVPMGISEVAARLLTSTQSQPPGTVKATGTGMTPAVSATGYLTFYNALPVPQTVPPGKCIVTGMDGVQVMNTQPANIPKANPPTEGVMTMVAAQAVNAGPRGNIAASDINFAQCYINGVALTGVTVQNPKAFSGGQNQQTFQAVSQNDLAGFATNALETSLMNAAKADLMHHQKKSNEQFVGSISCPATVDSNPKVGQPATTVKVTVTVTCSGEVYDQVAAFASASKQLKSMEDQNLGLPYKLVVGPTNCPLVPPCIKGIQLMVTQANIVDKEGTVAVGIVAKGRWAYTFDDPDHVHDPQSLTSQSLAAKIAGKSENEATNILLGLKTLNGLPVVSNQPGPTFVISGGGTTLPTASGRGSGPITIVVGHVPELPVTVTPTAGSGTPGGPGSTATSGPATPTATPTPVNGLGGS